MADASGESRTAKWVCGTDLGWAQQIKAKMYRNTVSLDAMAAELAAPIKTFTIELSTSIEAAWDNIQLYPTYYAPEPEYNYVLNPGFESTTDEVVGEGEDAVTVKVPDYWTFYGTTAAEAVGTNGGSEGENYIALLDGTRAQLELTGEQLPGNNIYKIELDYKQLGTDGFIKIEDLLTGATLLEASMGEETGTSEDDMQWKTYTNYFILKEGNTNGIRLYLRNGIDEYLCYYDNIRINMVEGYDPTNLVINGNFEMAHTIGSSDILGWRNLNTAVSAVGGLKDGRNCAFVQGTTSTLAQKVEINDYDEVNGCNYGYTLTWDFGYHNGGRPGFKVVVAFEDGTSVEQDIALLRATYGTEKNEWAYNEDGTINVTTYDAEGNLVSSVPMNTESQIAAYLWQWNELTYDLTPLTRSNTSPVETIDIQFVSGREGHYADNVVLKANKPDVVITNTDGYIANIIEDKTNYTATARYFGEAEDATLFFALYEVLEDGTLQLADVKLAGVANAAKAELTFENMKLKAGGNVVKAMLLEKGKLKPVAMRVID